MSALERDVRRRFAELPYQRFGRCSKCRRRREESERPLWLGGRVLGALVCIDCFDEAGAPGRRAA